jgi:hypothetical protein
MLHLACGQEADRKKGRQDEEEDGERQVGFYPTYRSRASRE